MTGYVLTPAAQADVEDIWNYTAERWNEVQAVRYIQSIRDACRELAAGTRMSRQVDIREGYRKLPVGSHMLYFRIIGGGPIVIVRILHQKMDVNRHL